MFIKLTESSGGNPLIVGTAHVHHAWESGGRTHVQTSSSTLIVEEPLAEVERRLRAAAHGGWAAGWRPEVPFSSGDGT